MISLASGGTGPERAWPVRASNVDPCQSHVKVSPSSFNEPPWCMHTLRKARGFPFCIITRTSRPRRSAVTVPSGGMSSIAIRGSLIVASLGGTGRLTTYIATFPAAARAVGLPGPLAVGLRRLLRQRDVHPRSPLGPRDQPFPVAGDELATGVERTAEAAARAPHLPDEAALALGEVRLVGRRPVGSEIQRGVVPAIRVVADDLGPLHLGFADGRVDEANSAAPPGS